MKDWRERRALSALVLWALSLSRPLSRPAAAMTPKAADTALLGLPRKEVLRPDGMLSGSFGGIYTLDSGGRLLYTMDTQPLNDGTGNGHTVPVQHIAISGP